MRTVGICVVTIEGGVVCHQEIGREAARREVDIPEIVTHTPLYSDISRALAARDFSALAETLIDSVARLTIAGADFAVIPSNTVHFAFDEVDAASPVPLLSIVDATAEHCRAEGYRRIGVLGTAATVEGRLYDKTLAARGIEPSYPSGDVAGEIDSLIHDELVRGRFTREARDRVRGLVDSWPVPVDAVVLGCTELPLLLDGTDCAVPLVDTTRILAHAALDTAHGESAASGG